jgi:hypothetical protein
MKTALEPYPDAIAENRSLQKQEGILCVKALTAWKKFSMTYERMAAKGSLQKVKSPCKA